MEGKVRLCVLSVLLGWYALGVHTIDDDENTTMNSDILDWHDTICLDFNGSYGRKPNMGILCCNNTMLQLPASLVENFDTNEQLINCLLDLKMSQSSDLINGLWNVTLCLFRNSSAFTAGKVSFKEYVNYVTKEYPKSMADNIKKAAMSSCGKIKVNNKNPVAALRAFSECFYQAEATFCGKPSDPTSFRIIDKEHSCPAIKYLHGPRREEYCCKKQALPFNFLDAYLKFPEDDERREKEENCSQSFANRQMELDKTLKAEIAKFDSSSDESLNSSVSNSDDEDKENPRDKLFDCASACQVAPKNYKSTKDLTVEYESSLVWLTSTFGPKVQKELRKSILKTKKNSIVYFGRQKNLTHSQLSKEFKSGSEISKIEFHCGFATTMLDEAERALYEYCYDGKIADKWFTIHRQHADSL